MRPSFLDGATKAHKACGRRDKLEKYGTLAPTNFPARTPVTLGIIVTAIGTALIHLYLGLQGYPLFVLNGLGYLGLLAALILPIPRISDYWNMTRWVLVSYTALTIFLWILVGARNAIGYADKAIEIALIVLLLIETRRPGR